MDGDVTLTLPSPSLSVTSSSPSHSSLIFTTTRQQSVPTMSSRVISLTSSSPSPSDRLSFPTTFAGEPEVVPAGTERRNGGNKERKNSSGPECPVFERKPKSASVVEGDTVEFTYLVRASPPVDIEWVKDGRPVKLTGNRFTASTQHRIFIMCDKVIHIKRCSVFVL